MKRRFNKIVEEKQVLASLLEKTKRADVKLKTKLLEAREKNNALIDQIFESLFTIGISYGMSAIGFKTAAYFFNSTSLGDQLIENERMAAALPWMENFLRLRPGLRATHTPRSLFLAFQSIIASWDAEIAGKTAAELTRIYGEERELLSQAVAYDISKLIGTEDANWIKKFYNYGLYANKTGIFVFELKISYLLTFSVPFLRHAFIEPQIKPLLHKLYNLRYLSEVPLKGLTQNKANELLLRCEKEKLFLEKLSKAGVWFNYMLALGAIASIIYTHEEGRWPSPEMMIYISATFMKLMIQTAQNYYEKQKQIALEKKITSIITIFEGMLAFTRGEIELHRGKYLSDCYITFRARPYENLSEALVNQVVKNTLLKNGMTIIDNTQTTHSFGLQELSRLQARIIVEQIKDVLNFRVTIKMYGARGNQLPTLFVLPTENPFISKSVEKVEETDTAESAKEYFIMLKRNGEVKKLHDVLKTLFDDVKKQLKTFKNKNRFYKTQEFILNNIEEQYFLAKKDEETFLKIIKANPTKTIPQDKKNHIHLVKRMEVIKTYLVDMQNACEKYEIECKKKLALLPGARAASPQPVAVSNVSGTLYGPSANEKIFYNSSVNTFVYNLVNFAYYEVDGTVLGKNIQINALLFEIYEFMKLRATTHAQLRNDPSESFSRYIQTALSYSKNLVNKDFSAEAITLVHAEVILFARTLVDAITCDNYSTLKTNTFCARLLKHGKDLDDSPEVITDDAAHMLITGTLVQAFKTYAQPLPNGMLLAAFRMANLQAETYDGYVQPLRYLVHLAETSTNKFKVN